MQILHLHTDLKLSCGITRIIFQLMKNSSADSTHYAMAFGGNALYKFKKERLGVALIPRYYKFLFAPIHIMSIYKFCKENNISIIHAHHRYFDFLGNIVAKLLNIPIVMSVHSKVESKKLFSYKAKNIIAVSNSLKKHLIEKFNVAENRITVINNFIDEGQYTTNPDEIKQLKYELGIYGDKTIVMFIGRFSKQKGVDLLIEAFKKLQYEYIDLVLVMIGDGELKKGIMKEKLKDVKIIEAKENIAPFLEMADLFVLPSRVDPYPMVMIEAGLMKIPFLGSSVDGISEYIKDGENGVLVKPDNKGELVQGMMKMLDNASLRLRLAENLHKKVMTSSLKQHILPKYYAYYSSLIK